MGPPGDHTPRDLQVRATRNKASQASSGPLMARHSGYSASSCSHPHHPHHHSHDQLVGRKRMHEDSSMPPVCLSPAFELHDTPCSTLQPKPAAATHSAHLPLCDTTQQQPAVGAHAHGAQFVQGSNVPATTVEPLLQAAPHATTGLATQQSITSSCTQVQAILTAPDASPTDSDDVPCSSLQPCQAVQVFLDQQEGQFFNLASAFRPQSSHQHPFGRQPWQPAPKRSKTHALEPLALLCNSSNTAVPCRSLQPPSLWLLSRQQQQQELTPIALTTRCRPMCAPAAPRLLCHLSPASLARSCSMLPYSRNTSCSMLTPSKMLAACLPSTPLPLNPQEYMAAAMRLLSYSEPTTLRLALHCWHVVEPKLEQGQYAGLQGLGRVRFRREDMLRAGALVTLWTASKCEESRQQVAKPAVAATLLPPALSGQGAAFITAMEMWLLQQLDWSPYRGFSG